MAITCGDAHLRQSERSWRVTPPRSAPRTPTPTPPSSPRTRSRWTRTRARHKDGGDPCLHSGGPSTAARRCGSRSCEVHPVADKAAITFHITLTLVGGSTMHIRGVEIFTVTDDGLDLRRGCLLGRRGRDVRVRQDPVLVELHGVRRFCSSQQNGRGPVRGLAESGRLEVMGGLMRTYRSGGYKRRRPFPRSASIARVAGGRGGSCSWPGWERSSHRPLPPPPVLRRRDGRRSSPRRPLDAGNGSTNPHVYTSPRPLAPAPPGASPWAGATTRRKALGPHRVTEREHVDGY